MSRLPRGEQATKDAVRRAFLCEKPDSGTRVSEGETGCEEMWEARETDKLDGDQGGGTGRGVSVTSIWGSSGTEVVMVWYCSWSAKDSD